MRLQARRTRIPRFAGVILLSLLAGSGVARSEDETGPRVTIPFVGLDGADPFDPAHQDPQRLQALSGLGSALVRTVPIAWERIEPHAPVLGGRHLHDWEALDAFFRAWQSAGFDPVLVLDPRSSWASMPFEKATWPREARAALPAAEADVLLRRRDGACPPGPDAWRDWECFVRDVVERYDHDGVDDAPGLERTLTWIQIVDRPASPQDWTGSAPCYLRLLHHASLGAAKASLRVRLAHGAVDFSTMGREPLPDAKEIERRVREANHASPAARAFEAEWALSFLRMTLSLAGLYRAVPHVGSPHLADETVDLRYLRHLVDAGIGTGTEVWLVDDPAAKLGESDLDRAGGPSPDERLLRARWRAAARRTSGPTQVRGLARDWLRTGRAYDVVRTLGTALAAGADRVFLGGAARPDALGVFAEAGEGGAWRRTPAWYALRQANRLLLAHASVEEKTISTAVTTWRFAFREGHQPAWVLVIALDPDKSWAGHPEEGAPVRDVVVPLPDGPYVVESMALSDGDGERRRVRVVGGVLRLPLTPAPVWVYPDV